MNKLIITIGLLSGLTYQTDGTRVDYIEKVKFIIQNKYDERWIIIT
tara:strand:- start:627 stop:764 length:138 start_codon:yes stop_codon:yes gene_type:complete